MEHQSDNHFDLIVVGSGSGNALIDESFASQRIALIDDGPFGGTCLNAGCIPTKMCIYPMDLLLEASRLPDLGVEAHLGPSHWEAIRRRVMDRVDGISRSAAISRAAQPNLELIEATARFVGPKTLDVGGRIITGDKIVIAAGSRPHMPDIEGLDEVRSRVLTSKSVLRMERLPKAMVIIGGGVVGSEFAHLFSTLGVDVSIVGRGSSLLPHEDAQVSQFFTHAMSQRCVVGLRQTVVDVDQTQVGVVVTARDEAGVEYEYDAEVLLMATGRVPNTDLLDVAAGGLETHADGCLKVDEFLRTNVDGVYGLGDIVTTDRYKHVANHHMRVVRYNLHHPDAPVAARMEAVPHAVFGHPQIGGVGLTEQQCRERGLDISVGVRNYADVAFGWAMEADAEAGFAKVIIDKASHKILGAHIVGHYASTLVQPLVLAISQGISAVDVARGQMWIHPALPELVENAVLDALADAVDVDPAALT